MFQTLVLFNMVSDDVFDPRRASSSSAAAAPPPSTLATESPFMASAPLAWAQPAASGSHPPAPPRSPVVPPPISSTAPVPVPSHDAPQAPGSYGAHAQVPYGGPYPAPYVTPSPAPYAPSSAVPYEAPYGAPYAAPASYVAPLLLPYGVSSTAPYGHHQQYRAPPSADALVSYSVPPSYDSQLSAPVAEPGPFHFAHLVTVKLSADNYLLWRAQVLPLMRSHYLEGYVDGTLPCPPAVVPMPSVNGGSVMVPNPAHRRWIAQDQAILGAIQSSLTPSVAGMVVFAATSRDAWATLDSSFSSQSLARSSAIRNQLGEIKKHDLSATAFFNKVKNLADTLSSIGKPLSDEEFTSFILNGLDEDYDSLVENINGRDTPMPPRDLYARLLNTEQRLSARRSVGAYTDGSSANAAHRGGPRGAKQPPPPSPTHQPRPSAPAPPTAGRKRLHCQACGGGVECQLCSIEGHLASRCHRRFKRDFLGIGNNGKGNEKQAALATQEPGFTPSYPVDPAWYMDTGAMDHLTSQLDKLATRQPYTGHDQVRTANGSGMHISHVGQASLLSRTTKNLRLLDILRVPSVTRSLLSVPKLTRDNNVFVEFHPFHFFVKDRDTRDVLLSGRARHGLYALDVPSVSQVFSGVRVSSSQWHSRLGHPATPIVRHVLHHHNLPVESRNKEFLVCDACQQGKSHQLPFSVSSRVVKAPLELVFSDVWGYAQTSVSGHNYYVSFIDAFSRFTWIYLIKRKSDVFHVFMQFQAHVERLLKHKIVHVQSNWGGGVEYRNLNTFFQKLGISHHVSCPHTHQQNGAAERKHRHIVETGLTLLAHASVPFRFWSDAFVTACFLINRLPTRLLHMKSPLEVLLHETPDYSFLKVFGCACWPHLRPYNNHKLEYRSKKCVFLGYSPLHKGYKCLHVPTNRVYISRDVVFDETVFPFSTLTPPTDTTTTSLHSFPVLPDQFVDAAYSPLLLPNHGAGTGRGARLELLDNAVVSAAPAAAATPGAPGVDRTCMPHARGSDESAASPSPAARAALSPGAAASPISASHGPSSTGPSPPVTPGPASALPSPQAEPVDSPAGVPPSPCVLPDVGSPAVTASPTPAPVILRPRTRSSAWHSTLARCYGAGDSCSSEE